MTSMTIMPIFASNLVITNVDEKFNDIDKDKIMFRQNIGKGQTTDISISKYVLEEYPKLGTHILNIFNEYSFNTLRYKNKFSYSTSWFVRSKPDDFCRYHHHCNSFYSGLFYFDDYNYESGDICFLNPNVQIEKFFINVKNKEDVNIHNAKEWLIRPEKNLLIFFPSYLWHTIITNTSNEPRHSLAFNLIPIGEYGLGDSTYNTEWFEK